MYPSSYPLLGLLLLLLAAGASADSLVKPHSFSAGSPAVAAEVNENFDVLYQAMTAAEGTIAALAAETSALQARIGALEAQVEALAGMLEPIAVRIRTSLGNIDLELYPSKAPVTVANFLAYLDSGFYSGTIFHRVEAGFVIQGGGFDAALALKPTNGAIVNEALNGLMNRRGTIAMARTSAIDSATAQFYINLGDNRALDPLISLGSASALYGYTVFGKVVDGMDVVDAIGAVAVEDRDGLTKVPVTTVEILGVQRL